jgi:cell division septation protein DedD
MTGTENATDQEEPPGNGLPVAPAVEPGYNEPDDKTGSNDIIKDADEKNNGNSTGGLTFPETLAAMEPAAVKPKPKPKSEAKPAQLDKENQNKAAGKSDGIYTVQVGAFKESESAKRLVDRLKKEGFEAEYRRADGAAGLYKVRVGSFASLADARGIAAKLESKEGLKPYVTSY